MAARLLNPTAESIVTEIVDELYRRPILSNLTRPVFVEKLVVRCLGSGWRHVGSDWVGWDIEHAGSRMRVEVKQSAALQTWTNWPGANRKPTLPEYDIAPRTGYYTDGGSRWVGKPGRPADLYIFAWHGMIEPIDKVDHADPDQWEFYLLPESRLPVGQNRIRLSSLKRLNPIAASAHNLPTKLAELMPALEPFKHTLDEPSP